MMNYLLLLIIKHLLLITKLLLLKMELRKPIKNCEQILLKMVCKTGDLNILILSKWWTNFINDKGTFVTNVVIVITDDGTT